MEFWNDVAGAQGTESSFISVCLETTALLLKCEAVVQAASVGEEAPLTSAFSRLLTVPCEMAVCLASWIRNIRAVMYWSGTDWAKQ